MGRGDLLGALATVLVLGCGARTWLFAELGAGAQDASAPLAEAASPCTTGRVVLATPASLATDGTTLYFTDIGDGSTGAGMLGSVPVTGGTVTALASSLSGPSGVAIDAANVYWLDDTGAVNEEPR